MKSSRFDTDAENQWCPGCGNFAILNAMKQSFATQGLNPEDILLVAGIGQAGKTPHYLSCNMLHGLHGRALPLATGAKIANHHLNIVVNTGDGDCYGSGGNHLLAAIRRNIDITLLVHNNQVYGLTKGQASPTTAQGMTTKIQDQGVVSNPLNPIATALSAGAGFVAQGFSGNVDQLSDLIIKAMLHKGFAMVDIFQPCVSFNKLNTHQWYKDRIFDLSETDHDPTDFGQAMALAHTNHSNTSHPEKMPTGIIYQTESPTFHERLSRLKKKALVDYDFAKSQMSDILNRT